MQVQGVIPPPSLQRQWSLLGLGHVEWLLLLVAVIWGGSYAAAKTATTHLPVLEFLCLRFGLTFMLLLPALKALVDLPWREVLATSMFLGINLLAIFICETYGVSLTTASNAAFLISLCVAFTPLCEWWRLQQKPNSKVMLAVGISVLGAGLLAFQKGLGTGLHAGDLLMLTAAFLRGVMVCMTRKFSLINQVPALTLTALQMGVMTLGLTLILVFQGKGLPALPNSASFWWVMAFLVLMCTLLAFFVQNYAVSRTSPSRVALLMGSEPMWGALIAVACMGEALTPQGWLGGALIVAAALWVSQTSADRK